MFTIKKILFHFSFLLLFGNIGFTQSLLDTTVRCRYFLRGDSSFGSNRVLAQKSGNTIILSTAKSGLSGKDIQVVSKLNKAGAFVWSKAINNPLDSNIQFYTALELSDGSIALYGIIDNVPTVNNNSRHFILRLNTQGNVISYKYFTINVSLSIAGVYEAFLCELENNDITLLIHLSADFVSSLFFVARFSAANQNVWSKFWFTTIDNYTPLGVISVNANLLIPGKFYSSFSTTPCDPLIGKGSSITKINSLTGDIIQTKTYCYPSGSSLGDVNTSPIFSYLKNGTINVFSPNSDNGKINMVGIVYDTLLNVIKSKSIQGITGIDLIFPVVNYLANSNGAAVIGCYDPTDNQHIPYLAIDSNFNILQQRKVRVDSFISGNYDYQLTLKPDDKVNLLYPVKNGNKEEIESVETSIYNCDTTCIGRNVNFAEVKDFPLTPSNANFFQPITNNVVDVPFTLNLRDIAIQKTVLCQSINNLHDSIKIRGADTICNINNAIIYTAFRGTKCAGTTWSIDTASHAVITIINDTTINIQFTQAWSGYLYATSTGNIAIKDSIKLVVLQINSTPILPADTSICEGTFVKLDAGNNFAAYAWNTGAISSSIFVSKSGIYTLKATYNTGCYTTDSFEIKKVYPKPIVQLDSTHFICKGKNTTLNSGAGFVKYLWQDGSANQTFTVKNTGLFWVQVRDTNGCYGADTTIISTTADTPSHFIYTDTSICKYQSIELIPFKTFQSYYWSTGESSPSLIVNGAGVYDLSVTDTNGCAGMESIHVRPKTCINNLIFPNAFSPNKDGKNDVFKPYTTGIFYQYQLSIYNRWGQKIFSTNNPNSGWDGTYKSGQQNTSTFVWVCTYQFAGETVKTQKGTILLVM